MSSIEETWEETLVIRPLDVIPMWSQMEDSGDCSGFILTTRNVSNCRVARDGSLQMEEEGADKGS